MTDVPPRLPDDLSELPILDLKEFIEAGTDGWFTTMWRDFHAAIQNPIQVPAFEMTEASDAVKARIAEIFDVPEGVLDLTDEQLHRLLHPRLYADTLTKPE